MKNLFKYLYKKHVYNHGIINISVNLYLLFCFIFFVSIVNFSYNAETDYFHLKNENIFCDTDKKESFFYQYIPMIYKPVDFIYNSGNSLRSDIILCVYSAYWYFLSIFIIFILLLFSLTIILTSKKYILFSINLYNDAMKDKNRENYLNNAYVDSFSFNCCVFFVMIIFLYYMVFDDFSFHQHSFLKNMVHERNRDFYYPSIFFTSFLIFLMHFYFNAFIFIAKLKLKFGSS